MFIRFNNHIFNSQNIVMITPPFRDNAPVDSGLGYRIDLVIQTLTSTSLFSEDFATADQAQNRLESLLAELQTGDIA
jgi:hypothetical protein